MKRTIESRVARLEKLMKVYDKAAKKCGWYERGGALYWRQGDVEMLIAPKA